MSAPTLSTGLFRWTRCPARAREFESRCRLELRSSGIWKTTPPRRSRGAGFDQLMTSWGGFFARLAATDEEGRVFRGSLLPDAHGSRASRHAPRRNTATNLSDAAG